MQVSVYSMAGEVVDTIDLDDSVFGIPKHEPVMHQAVVAQLANARQGTASTKTRGRVSGGGKKPYRQKGTGRARQGGTRAPHFRGGGVAFGPHPRDYHQELPKKMRRLAIRSALSWKTADGELLVLQDLGFEEPRTKAMVAVLKSLNVDGPTLVVTAEPDPNVIRSARNIPGVWTLPADYLNVVDLLRHRNLLLTVDAVRRVERWLSAKRSTSGQPSAVSGQ